MPAFRNKIRAKAALTLLEFGFCSHRQFTPFSAPLRGASLNLPSFGTC